MSVCVLGSINLDIVARVGQLPGRGETVLGHGLEQSPGGKGLNQAVAAARFGVATRLIGAIGDDPAGGRLRAFLRDAGVEDGDVRQVGNLPTGQAFICLAADGDNMIVVTPGANAALTAADIAAARLDGAGVLVAQFETRFAAIEAFFRSPAAAGAVKILNAAPALPDGKYLFARADIVVVNETELARFSGMSVAGAHEAARAARSVLSVGRSMIVTLGADGALVVGSQDVHHVPGRSVKAVDTVGAGDCFCGVLAAALSQKATLAEAVETANAAAALSVSRPGAAPSMPSRQEVCEFLAPGPRLS